MKYKPLEECVETVIDHRGLTPKKLQGDWSQVGYRAISAKNIKNGILVNEGSMKRVDSALYKRWMTEEIERGYIFITSEAPFGEVLYWDSDEKLVISQRVFGLKARSSICDARYLYYWMRCPYFQREMMGRSTGTTVTGLRQPELLKCVVAVPDLDVQKKIASTLSIIDKKIELNNRLNDYLEELIKTFFRYWFIDFVPFKDEVKRTSEIGDIPASMELAPLVKLTATITKGTTPTTLGYQYVNSGVNFIKGESILDDHTFDHSKFAHIDKVANTALKRSIIQDRDLLFTIAGTLGRFAMAEPGMLPANTNQAVGIIRVDPVLLSPEVLFSYFIGGWQKSYYARRVQQAVQANLNLTTLKSLPVPVLKDRRRLEYERQIIPLVKAMEANASESRTLANLRDTLLPKLMSGEIDVSGI